MEEGPTEEQRQAAAARDEACLRAERTLVMRLPSSVEVRDALREDGPGYAPITVRMLLIRPEDSDGSDGTGAGKGAGKGAATDASSVGEVGLVGGIASLREELLDAMNVQKAMTTAHGDSSPAIHTATAMIEVPLRAATGGPFRNPHLPPGEEEPVVSCLRVQVTMNHVEDVEGEEESRREQLRSRLRLPA